DVSVVMEGSPLLDNNIAEHLAQVQQLFPPGTFFAIARTPDPADNPMRSDFQGQCAVLQITGDVEAVPGNSQQWRLPTNPGQSELNANFAALFDTSAEAADWNTVQDNTVDASILPLGRLRWSRYEVDYTIPTLPYLVRYDILGFRDGDPENFGAIDYPHCLAGQCPGPQLHLPGSNDEPGAVAVGPMVEDIQVAVGCDGYTAVAAANASPAIVPPDPGFEEQGPSGGPTPGQPNFQVDENLPGDQRDRDEWLGNARNEVSAPDCVYYGTGEINAAQWSLVEGDQNPPPSFRMSPQSIRITLVASSETDEAAGGFAGPDVLAVEDRAPLPSPVGVRQRFTLTEVFTPRNLRWRDPTVL
ncbi:MAG: hypothetical protein K0V04_41130, partial [Deltaproteobacteria bacterium]|nr:hypothetical protein [Deltaproteobacteria bacterium]